MKFAALFTALATLPVVLGQLTINTPPSVVECEPTQLNWSGGVSPYYLSIIPGGQASAPPLKQFATQTTTAYTWNVDLQSGTSITFSLKDGTGATAYSDIVQIQSGSSTSCLNTTVEETGSGSSVASPTAGSGSASSGSPTKASPASSSSPAANAASRLSTSATLGVAAFMGLVGAALF